MGKFRSKLKGQTKGKRWPKGQSSSSNPVTRKYRDAAKSSFFQVETGPSQLTSASLMKHDALQLYKTGDRDVEMPDHMESESSYSGASGSYQSMQSFASDWSECSNMSFNKFMRTFQASSALHKEMLAILAAITEVIKMNGGTESSTEYYCSLLTTLDTLYTAEEKKEEQVTAVLALLNMGIKTVPEPVLKKTFSDVTMKMLQMLQDYSSAENNAIIKALLGILATVLRAQELALWNLESTKQIFGALINPFCIHSKPKWRKAAQHAVAAIVRSPCFETSNHNPAADKCADFCQEILANCTGGDVNAIKSRQTTILHTLGLLKETIQSFSPSNIKKCCETILRLMTLNYPIVTSSGLQVLHSLFAAQKSVVSSDLNGKLIAALYEYQPSNTDVQPTLAWLLVMQEAHVHLTDVDLPVSVSLLPAFFGNVVQMWLSGKTEVISGATHCLEVSAFSLKRLKYKGFWQVLLKDAVSPACESEQAAQQHRPKLEKCFNTVSACLSYQYNAAWSQVLHVIGVMFEVAGANCSDLLEETLCSLAELRDSYKFRSVSLERITFPQHVSTAFFCSFNSEVEYAMGAAIRSMGPEKVLDVVPLRRENGELNMERSWLLPVLKENINGAHLSFFREGILPLANFCQQRAAQLAQVNNGIGAHSSELLYMQLWNLLPCFCNQPPDIQGEFKSLAKLLGELLEMSKVLWAIFL